MLSSAVVYASSQESQFQLILNMVPSSVEVSTSKRCVFIIRSRENGMQTQPWGCRGLVFTKPPLHSRADSPLHPNAKLQPSMEGTRC